MAKRPAVARLQHMLGAIDEAYEYLDGRDYAAYTQSIATKRAVERCIEIVSEASRHVPNSLTGLHPEVPWDAVREIGNVLRHRYYAVSDHVVWRTAALSLIELRTVVVALIAMATQGADEV